MIVIRNRRMESISNIPTAAIAGYCFNCCTITIHTGMPQA